jgi:site-specific DNA-methyltransferase (adenine-specific)
LEPILWFVKPYKLGTTIADNVLQHGVGAYHQDALASYAPESKNLLEVGFEPGEAGRHPTQKPVRLMSALIELTTSPGQLVVDPFAGSGSTLVAAKGLGRGYFGIELDPQHAAVAEARLSETHARSRLNAAAAQ